MSTPRRPQHTTLTATAAVAFIAIILLLGYGLSPSTAQPAAFNADSRSHLSLTGSRATFHLAPGVPAHWEIGVTTQPTSATTLLSRVTATGGLATASSTALVISLSSCTAPWHSTSCPATEHRILTPTPLPELTDDPASVVDTGTIPAHAYLLASVLQPSQSPVTTSRSTEITITISATGDDPPATELPASTPGSQISDGHLAYTGTRIGLATLLAGASITLGVCLATAARRTRRREQP